MALPVSRDNRPRANVAFRVSAGLLRGNTPGLTSGLRRAAFCGAANRLMENYPKMDAFWPVLMTRFEIKPLQIPLRS